MSPNIYPYLTITSYENVDLLGQIWDTTFTKSNKCGESILATFTKRGDYQWQAKVRRRGYPTQSKTFTNKADAEVWARLIEGEIDRGVFVSRVEAESTTLFEALERYATEISVKKKGYLQEITRLRKWQSNPLSVRFLSNIKGSDLAKYRDERRKAGKAENTIRLDLALLSHLFETARREWGMESLTNPVKNIKLPAGSNQRSRRLEDAEEAYLLTALQKSSRPITRLITEFAIETAMRQSEILRLDWKDINFDRRVAFLKDTKNGESRNVPLSTKAVLVLSSLVRPLEGGKIFAISQDRLIRIFEKACTAGRAAYLKECAMHGKEPKENFLENLRFHDLRHEATTRLFERGLDMMEVASISGHKSLAMLKRYTHLKAEDLALKLG